MTYLHNSDAAIVRNDTAYPDSYHAALLVDEEGYIKFRFPLDWTDNQIYHALNFANRAYKEGVEQGKYLQQCEIKKVLGV